MPLPLIPIVGTIIAGGVSLTVGKGINSWRKVTCPTCNKKVHNWEIDKCGECNIKGCTNCMKRQERAEWQQLVNECIQKIDNKFCYEDILSMLVEKFYGHKDNGGKSYRYYGRYCNKHTKNQKDIIKKIVEKCLSSFQITRIYEERIVTYKTSEKIGNKIEYGKRHDTMMLEVILEEKANKNISAGQIYNIKEYEVGYNNAAFKEEMVEPQDILKFIWDEWDVPTYASNKQSLDNTLDTVIAVKLIASYYGYEVVYDFHSSVGGMTCFMGKIKKEYWLNEGQ